MPTVHYKPFSNPLHYKGTQKAMRSPRIDLAYAQDINSCPAIENNHPCLDNPRWIEKDWPLHSVQDLNRARSDLETHWGSFDHDQRVERSKTLIHGQTCSAHGMYSRRLHTALMIRGYARAGRKGPRVLKRKPNLKHKPAKRTGNKKPVRTAHWQTLEVGRVQRYVVDEMKDAEASTFNPSA